MQRSKPYDFTSFDWGSKKTHLYPPCFWQIQPFNAARPVLEKGLFVSFSRSRTIVWLDVAVGGLRYYSFGTGGP